ncbi:MAG: flagellar motor protein MotB, partial [Candidatus Binatia bacterium]
MTSSEEPRPRIIIRKRRGSYGHNNRIGVWKLAYADFVTAMMAFFLVMWILGLNQESRKAIAAYFQDPAGFMKSHSGGV